MTIGTGSSKRQLRFACIGEAMLELSTLSLAEGQAKIGMAGDMFNTAVYLKRALGATNASVSFVTMLGDDPLSDQMIETCDQEGLDTSLIGRHPTRLPGIYSISVDGAGERSFDYWRSASAARTLFGGMFPHFDSLNGYDCVILSGITLAILPPHMRETLTAKCEDLRQRGASIVFDSNYRPGLWGSEEEARAAFEAMWEVATHGFPSADDEVLLHPGETDRDTLVRIAAHGVQEIVLKRGSRGPVLRMDDQVHIPELTPVETVIDTTAAGDSFDAGYIAARAMNVDPLEALTLAHDLAARVIAHRGAILPARQGQDPLQ